MTLNYIIAGFMKGVATFQKSKAEMKLTHDQMEFRDASSREAQDTTEYMARKKEIKAEFNEKLQNDNGGNLDDFAFLREELEEELEEQLKDLEDEHASQSAINEQLKDDAEFAVTKDQEELDSINKRIESLDDTSEDISSRHTYGFK